MAEKPVRKLSILALLASLALSASAFTVGIAPAEGATYAPPPLGRGSPMGYLVSGCLDTLFEAGYIATDRAVSWTPHDSWGLADYGLAEAKDGSVNYVIAVFVEWASSSFRKNMLLPASVDFRLMRVLDGKVLAEGTVHGPSDSEITASHESRTAAQAGASAVEPCVKMLSTLAKGGE
jgi:hypothetical protein